MGPASEACPNSATVSGNSPIVATACALAKPRSNDVSPRGRHHTSHATPHTLSQKPAPSRDNGSTTIIAVTASASAAKGDSGRRTRRAPATTAIINVVRTVGSAKPDAAV